MNELITIKLQEAVSLFTEDFTEEWFGAFVFGSQNYGLEYEGSDIDVRIIYISDKNKPCRFRVLETGEHIEAISLFNFYVGLRDMDFQCLETLYSKYVLINSKYESFWNILQQRREELAHLNERLWLEQFLYQCKITKERFDNNITEDLASLEKFGYAVKPLYHFTRFEETIQKYLMGQPYEQVLLSDKREELIFIKQGGYSQADAKKLVNEKYQYLSNLTAPLLKTANMQLEYWLRKTFANFFEGRPI